MGSLEENGCQGCLWNHQDRSRHKIAAVCERQVQSRKANVGGHVNRGSRRDECVNSAAKRLSEIP